MPAFAPAPSAPALARGPPGRSAAAPLRASSHSAAARVPASAQVALQPALPTPSLRAQRSRPQHTPRWHAGLSQRYDHLGSESGRSEGSLAWKDRVALYAQFSAEETLDMLLQALRENSLSGPMKDDGIDALYAFANLDIWALTHRFFGKKMDLGQFERFKRVLVASPYDVLLRYRRIRTLSALRVDDETYISRRAFEAPGRPETVFTFTLTRAAFGGDEGTKRAWMVDSIIQDTVQ